MQEPTEEAEASIPMENGEEDSNLNGTFTVRHKAAKRTHSLWLLMVAANLASPLPSQDDEDIRTRKKPRLQEPFPASTHETAAMSISLHDTALSLPAAADGDHADADLVKGTRATGHWTPEEDAKLSSVVTDNRKKKLGKECTTDWDATAALAPGRSEEQCYNRWKDVLDGSSERERGRRGEWTAVEDSKLKNAVQIHGGRNWGAIAALVPGRTKMQCYNKWRDVLDPPIERARRRMDKWTAVEDMKLKDAVQIHGGNNWGAIAVLVPGRTEKQCYNRWRCALDPSMDRANGRTGRWSEDEDSQLKDAVQSYGSKNWGAIAALIPGRVGNQCRHRWKYVLDPNRVNGDHSKIAS
jgi:hypothetical protein